MFEPLTEFLKALAPWPLIQLAGFLVVAYVGVTAIKRGERDKKTGGNGNGPPTWSQYGPVHDAMGAVHEMNEQSRKQIDLLERIDTGMQACKTALEMIRNESRLR